VKVINTKNTLAKSRRVFLVNIEQCGKSGKWEATTYCESMQLPWSGGAYEQRDLPKGVPQFVDILSTCEGSNEFRLAIAKILNRQKTLLSTDGGYRRSWPPGMT